MFALTSQIAALPTRRVNNNAPPRRSSKIASRVPVKNPTTLRINASSLSSDDAPKPNRRGSIVRASAASQDKTPEPSRRGILALPGLAALAGVSDMMLPGSAKAKAAPGIKLANVPADAWTTDLAAFGPPNGPLGGAVQVELS
jgi:hypothetical protein